MKEKETNKLYHSITNVNEDYIEEAQNTKAEKTQPLWSKWGILAACLFLVVASTFAISNIFPPTPENSEYKVVSNENGNSNGYHVTQEGKTTDSSEKATVISSYGDADSTACYKAPDNGSCIYSIPLRNAMEKYGDTVIYKIIVDVFSNTTIVETNSEAVKNEIERLREIGYTVDFEQHNDETMTHDYFVLHATQAQLINFASNDNYGYMFWLYDEGAMGCVK